MSADRRVLFATSNAGKLAEARKIFAQADILVDGIADLPADLRHPDVKEVGETIEENALLKLAPYAETPGYIAVIADDTGLEITALDRKPGRFVRRWRDRNVEDTPQQAMEYILTRTADLPDGQREVAFVCALAIATPDRPEPFVTFGRLTGELLREPDPASGLDALPISRIFWMPGAQKSLAALHDEASEDQAPVTHRSLAFINAMVMLGR